MILIVALAAFAATFLGGLFALKLRDRLHLILGFSAGAVIGVAFFDLLPESIELAQIDPSHVFALAGLGFGLYLLLDRMIVLHRHSDDHAHDHARIARGLWGAGTLSFHSFLDGLGVGLAFQASTEVGIVVAAAVLAHDFSDGINTVSMIVKHGGDRLRALRWLTIDALAPVAGIFVASFLTLSSSQLGLLLSVFAGFFLYIGASDLLPESHHAHPVRWTTISTIVGMAVIYAVISLAH